MSTEPLDLSGANLRGFDPIDAKTYEMAVTNMEQVFTKSDNGKLPQGTPGWNVRFTVQGGEFDEKNVWNNYWLPTQEYADESPENAKKVATMRGMFGKFLIAVGYTEAEILSGSFVLDPDEIIGRRCSVVVGIQRSEEYGDRNVVRNVKPLQSIAESGIL